MRNPRRRYALKQKKTDVLKDASGNVWNSGIYQTLKSGKPRYTPRGNFWRLPNAEK